MRPSPYLALAAALLSLTACLGQPPAAPARLVASTVTPLTADPALAAFVDLLAHPALLARPENRARSAEIQAMLQAYAPRIWFHPDEPEAPMDPLRFLQNASLWFRHAWGKDTPVIPRGALRPEDLSAKGASYTSLAPVSRPHDSGSGDGFFINYEGPPLRRTASSAAPILWKLGVLPPSPHRDRVLIEYWYHLAYNHGPVLGIGDHQGDWEGISFLLELGIGPRRNLVHRALGAFFAAHEGGRWVHSADIRWIQDPRSGRHPEAFSALGSHATYPEAGKFRRFLLTDETAPGAAWDTWNHVRPLALEPYFGYTGAWGAASFFSFMTGPMVPGQTKTLPKLGASERIPTDFL